jgi:hypothetical protein
MKACFSSVQSHATFGKGHQHSTPLSLHFLQAIRTTLANHFFATSWKIGPSFRPHWGREYWPMSSVGENREVYGKKTGRGECARKKDIRYKVEIKCARVKI